MALHILGTGIAQAAHDAASTVTSSYDLDLGEVALTAMQGENLNVESCNDALDPSITVAVTAEYTATGGTLTILTIPTGEATPWGEVPESADVYLEQVVFTRDDNPAGIVVLEEPSFSVHIG